MADFPSYYKPTYSATKTSSPRTRIFRAGDGYENRITFGLNNNPKEWRLTFIDTDDDINTIETFLDARAADSTSFNWTPPDTNVTAKWVCNSWSRELIDMNISRLEVTFRQVFEP